MGSIRCDRESCEYNSASRWVPSSRMCRRGSGYDYGGGDIQVNKNGHCVSSERRKVKKALKETEK